MALRLESITLDAANALTVGTFWAETLGRPLADGASEDFAEIPAFEQGAGWMFIKVDEPKTAKNRMHLDFSSPDRQAEVERLVGLGATIVGEYIEWGADWTTLRDVEGNEFDVAQEPKPA